MAITMYEAFPSRETTLGDKCSVDLSYILMGTSDDTLAKMFIAAGTPTVWGNLKRQSIKLKETVPGTWDCTISYGAIKEPEKDDWKWDFDTSGGNQKITQSKENIHNYGAGARDFKGAIGVTDDSVEGCDIILPQFKWTETHQLGVDVVDWAYSQKLFDLTGKTNAAQFRGFGVKQVLFTGGKGAQSAKNPDLVEMTFQFSASRDAVGLTVGDIGGISKKAWEYLWVRYGLVADNPAPVSSSGTPPSPGKMTRKPISVHIERVYDSGDFGQLGIGS